MNVFASILQLYYMLPEALLIGVAMLLFLWPGRNKSPIVNLGLCAIVFAAAVVGLTFFGETRLFFGTYKIYLFSQFLKMVFLVLSFIVLWGSKAYLSSDEMRHTKEFVGFILIATAGLMAIGSAGDFITLFIAFEMVSVSTYALPLIDEREPNGKEAAFKYFLTGSFSSALILYGLSLVYGFTGSVMMSDIARYFRIEALTPQPVLILALVLMLAGFGYKMAVVPFHLWAPDTYQGSPTPVAAFLAGVTKKGAFVVALKLFLLTLVAIRLEISLLLGVVAALTMTVGNVVALRQDDMKRMMAYSSIAHAGNILTGLAIFTPLAVAGSLLHIIAHALMTVGVFFGLMAVAARRGGYDLKYFAGLRRTAPKTAFGLAVLLLGLAGIPPFIGFWSKMVMVIAAFEPGGWFIVLAAVLVINSAVSLVYYARLIKVMYMDTPSPDLNRPSAHQPVTALYICAVLTIILGLMPDQLVSVCTEAARLIIP